MFTQMAINDPDAPVMELPALNLLPLVGVVGVVVVFGALFLVEGMRMAADPHSVVGYRIRH